MPSVSLLFLLAALAGPEGTVSGQICWSGTLPASEGAKNEDGRAVEPACGPAPALDRPILLADGGRGLANVVVELLGSDNGKTDRAVVPVLATPVTVEQRGCSYWPRVQVAAKGQPIAVRNADPLLHNLHAYAGRKGLFNVAQPPGSPAVTRSVPAEAEVVRLRCDIHPWMVAYVVFADTPFIAVTDARGAFTLNHVPPGSYRLRTWHEQLGAREVAIEVVAGHPSGVALDLAADGGSGAGACAQASVPAAHSK